MFNWFKPKKTEQPQQNPEKPAQKPSREQLIEDAMKNARAAREAIGQETLDRIAELMRKKQQEQNSPMMQAKKILQNMDKEELTEGLRALRDQDKIH